MRKTLVTILRVLYWPVALIVLLVIPLCIKFATEPAKTPYGRTAAIALAITFATAFSGLTFLRFYKNRMKVVITAGHAAVFLLAFTFAIVGDRIEHARPGRRVAMIPSPSGQSVETPSNNVDPNFRMARMDACAPIVRAAQELRHQRQMLLMIEQAIVRELANGETEQARQKAQSTLDTMKAAQRSTSALRKQFASISFPPNLPTPFVQALQDYNSVQVQKAKIEEMRADTLRGFAEGGSPEAIVVLVKMDKEVVKKLLPKDEEFEKGFLNLCFSTPKKE